MNDETISRLYTTLQDNIIRELPVLQNNIIIATSNSQDTRGYNCSENVKSLKKQLLEATDNCVNYLNGYEYTFKNYNMASGLEKAYLIENEKSKLKLDSYKNNVNKDNTLYLYNKDSFEFINYIYNIILIIYYSVFILFLIFSNFIKNKYYRNNKYILLIILYLTIPAVAKYIINIIYNIYTYFAEKYNLNEPQISYDDILKYDSLNNEHLDAEFVDAYINTN